MSTLEGIAAYAPVSLAVATYLSTTLLDIWLEARGNHETRQRVMDTVRARSVQRSEGRLR